MGIEFFFSFSNFLFLFFHISLKCVCLKRGKKEEHKIYTQGVLTEEMLIEARNDVGAIFKSPLVHCTLC